MDIAALIDAPLWDKARWQTVLFRTQPGTVPVLALVFTDHEAAEAIVRGWRHLLGERDAREALRVSIIEGNIMGQDPGYTVHIGPEPSCALAATDAADATSGASARAATQLQRMPSLRSPHLENFKEAFAQERRYWLTAAILDAVGQPLMNRQHRILKSRVLFRRAAEITGANDLDSVVKARHGTQHCDPRMN
jgi:hypothetical protein